MGNKGSKAAAFNEAKNVETFRDGEKVVFCQFQEMAPISLLVTLKHEKNPNRHPLEQVKRLAKIMLQNGIRHPIVVSALSNRIIKGHGRLEAALYNGWTTFPIQRQAYASEAAEFADLVADNAIADWAELDLSQVNAELDSLGKDFDLELLGLQNSLMDPLQSEDVLSNPKGSTFKDKLEKFLENDVRVMQLAYPTETFDAIQKKLTILQHALSLNTNAQVIHYLVTHAEH